MVCINKNDIAYESLKEVTGLTEFELDYYINDYVETHGDYPTVDMFLRDTDTKQHFIKTHGLLKLGSCYTTKDNSPIDVVEANNQYRDLEVTTEQSARGTTIVKIEPRALKHRPLEPEVRPIKMLPAVTGDIEELAPILYNNGYYIYQYDNKFYKTTEPVSSTEVLKNYRVYKTQNDAINAEQRSSIKRVTGETTKILSNNINKLLCGLPVEVEQTAMPPSEFTIYGDFYYPEYEINATSKPFSKKNGKYAISQKFITKPGDLERLLLQAQGFSESEAINIVAQLQQPIQIKAIRVDKNTYAFKQKTPTININNVQGKRSSNNDTSEKLHAMLDRLEQLYGITFKRVTTQDIQNDPYLLQYVPDAERVNAFVLNGDIYINMTNAGLDAPIHEMGHILLGSLRQSNPELYNKLISSVESLPTYKYELSKYSHRTRMDANEEIFVDVFAKHYTEGLDINVDPLVLQDSEYEIARNIDSAIFPNTSTTSVSLQDIMNMSFDEIMNEFGTKLKDIHIMEILHGDKGSASRYIANLKEQLLTSGNLKEYCE